MPRHAVGLTVLALPAAPEDLVGDVRRSLDHGRVLQELLQAAAPRYIKALKRERAKARKSKKS